MSAMQERGREEWASYVAQEYIDGRTPDGIAWPLRVADEILSAIRSAEARGWVRCKQQINAIFEAGFDAAKKGSL